MNTSRGGGFSDHTRERQGGRLVYPVLSRRSGGLSLGINLFPDRKLCSFDCPYCEVFPPSPGLPFSPGELEAELEAFLAGWEAELGAVAIKDISLSGNGEPSLSPWLEEALEICAEARRGHGGAMAGTRLVVITNSTGFLIPAVRAVLDRFVKAEGLEVWAKLDSGTQEGFGALSGSSSLLKDILAGIAAFGASSPLIIQTMICSLDGRSPGVDDLDAYTAALASLLKNGAGIREVQLYTQARPSPHGRTAALDDKALLVDAARIMAGLVKELGPGLPPVRVFGSGGELGPIGARP